jgi:hypothetical protein
MQLSYFCQNLLKDSLFYNSLRASVLSFAEHMNELYLRYHLKLAHVSHNTFSNIISFIFIQSISFIVDSVIVNTRL